jgi:hydrogenase maturation protease
MPTATTDTITPSDAPAQLLVVGLGDVLRADDGLGPTAVARLCGRWLPPPGARVIDGGTRGLALLPLLAAADTVILVDALATPGLQPGTLVRLTGDDVPSATRDQLSKHQEAIAEVLGALHLLDRLPRRLVLLGVVPESLDLGFGCTATVEAALEGLLARIRAEAAALGFPFAPRTEPAGPGDGCECASLKRALA